MRLVLRGLVGLAGALALLVAVQFWLNPAGPAAQLGLAAQGSLGLATLRADMAGFFAVAGGLAVAAAVKAEARLLATPILLVGVALAGRVVTVFADGLEPPMVQPMVVEAVLLVLFAFGRRGLR